MKNYILFIFLFAVLESILFFNKLYALNVILFIIPLLIFLIVVLKQNKKIKNKCGLLFIIPIVLLSASYFIYDNDTIRMFNVLFIPVLILMMYIYTIEPTYKIPEFIKNIVYLTFEPFSCIGKFYNLVSMNLSKIFKISDTNKKKIKSFLIVIPIVIVVILLLSSADMVFNNIFDKFFDVFRNIKIDHIIGRIVRGLIFFTYLGAVVNYVIFNYKGEKVREKKPFKVDNYTIKLLLTSLNVIYLLFDFIQIKSLMLHQVAKNINYAQYARSGFFELMAISLINLVIILISKHTKEETKYSKIMSIVMVLLTLIIIISSAFRMHMYESVYGYTELRLLVYIALITEVILLIPTVIYILNSKTNIFKHYMIILVAVYTLVALTPLNYIIANNNINRYYDKGKIDIEYLENYSCDNVPLLKELHDKTDDKELKDDIADYLESNKFCTVKDVREYNISRIKANKDIKKLINKVFA